MLQPSGHDLDPVAAFAAGFSRVTTASQAGRSTSRAKTPLSPHRFQRLQAIIADLSKIPGLLGIARNSSFADKGKSVDLRVVGREPGVGHVLEGNVRRAGQRVRITAQLIDAETGAHLWADRCDRDMTDMFAAQDEVTLNIVEARAVRDDLVKIDPAFHVRTRLARLGYQRPEDPAAVLAGLSKAGIAG